MIRLLAVGIYDLCIFVFCVFGTHRLWLLWTYFKHKNLEKRAKLRSADAICQSLPPTPLSSTQTVSNQLSLDQDLISQANSQASNPQSSSTQAASTQSPIGSPVVTVQLPIYNEKYVVQRLIDAVCALNYPLEKLEIQVLDDSTDETVELIDQLVSQKQAQGFDIKAIRRSTRQGFKAGALQHGLNQCRGEFILIFDADFIPPSHLLEKGLPYFDHPAIGMVQFPWAHVNRDYSLLTCAQAVLLDGHFNIEHFVRSRSGRFFNFNGTAGIWRKRCILDAGGWQGDTLTEDMDLSYRAQLKGWVFTFVPDVPVPAELPIELNAFKSQQYRWAKGGVQTAIKLLPQLLREKIPLKTKVEAIFHLTSNLTYILIPCLILIFPLLILCSSCIPSAIYFISFVAAFISIILFYFTAQLDYMRGNIVKGFAVIPVLMAVSAGLCVNNSRAVLEAIFRRQSGFIRTPKYNILKKTDTLHQRRGYRVGSNVYFWVEIFLLVYLLCISVLGWNHQAYHVMPFMAIFIFGFFYFISLTIRQSYIH